MKKWGLISLLTLCLCLVYGPGAQAANAYTVKSGDCLWTISNATGVSVNTIKQLNGLSSDLLQIGQILILSNEAGSAAPAAEPTVAVASAGSATYIVQSGDNLWSIAQRYGTTVENIKSWNGLSSDFLQIGDQLIMGGTTASPVYTPTVSRAGSSATGSRIVEKAAQYLGTPYRYGGSGPGGFDCSGFSQYIYGQFGISLSRTAASQYDQGVWVSQADLLPGDLVFFNCGGSGINHVGIYSGGGQFIHSSSPRSGGVIYSPLTNGYYASTYIGARRIIR